MPLPNDSLFKPRMVVVMMITVNNMSIIYTHRANSQSVTHSLTQSSLVFDKKAREMDGITAAASAKIDHHPHHHRIALKS